MVADAPQSLSSVEDLRRAHAAANGKRSLEQAGLDEHRGLIPADVLVRRPVAFKLNDRDDRNFHAFSSRRNARQKPVDAD